MIGAIIGDIIGSVYENISDKPESFELFDPNCRATDDSILTLAVAKAVIEADRKNDFKHSKKYYTNYLRLFGRRYPDAGYGQTFNEWLHSEHPKPYHSYGNGSAMRVSPIGYVFNNLKDTLREAKKSAEVTHNHRDGIKGAKAVAGAVFLALHNCSKQGIKIFVEKKIGYLLDFNLQDLHNTYNFEIKCSRSVPQAIYVFLESNSFEDAIRKAIYIGGDSDTIACIAGGIAGAYYKKIPEVIRQRASFYLDAEQKRLIREFENKYNIKYL